MKAAFPRGAAVFPVCRQSGVRLAACQIGRAERDERAEGKIKETGTTLAGFLKLLLPAHWLGEPRAAPYYWTPRAAMLRKALALLDFDRHHDRRTPDFIGFWPEART